MKGRMWTQEEDDLIKKLHKTHTLIDMMKLPLLSERTYYSIRSRILKLKLGGTTLKKNKQHNWSKKQDDFIIKNYLHITAKHISTLPLFSSINYKSIISRASRLKVHKQPKWSKEEEDCLLKNYNKMIKKDLLKIPLLNKRSLTSIHYRLHKLGLTKNKRWSKEEEEYLIKNYKKTPPRTLIKSNILKNRNFESVLIRAYKLNIKRREHWRKEQDDFLRKNYNKIFIKDILKTPLFLNRTKSAIESKANKLGITKYRYGKDNYNWNGGSYEDHDGYIILYHKHDCPYSHNGRVKEHIYVWWKHYGDTNPILKDEVIHHINRIREDNHIGNLQKMSRKEHRRLHGKFKTDSIIINTNPEYMHSLLKIPIITPT